MVFPPPGTRSESVNLTKLEFTSQNVQTGGCQMFYSISSHRPQSTSSPWLREAKTTNDEEEATYDCQDIKKSMYIIYHNLPTLYLLIFRLDRTPRCISLSQYYCRLSLSGTHPLCLQQQEMWEPPQYAQSKLKWTGAEKDGLRKKIELHQNHSQVWNDYKVPPKALSNPERLQTGPNRPLLVFDDENYAQTARWSLERLKIQVGRL